MQKSLFTLLIGLFIISTSYAQEFILSAEIRPRLENRHGFKTLPRPDDETASFVSQRSRLVFDFKNEEKKVKLGMTLQNVRTWGDVPTLASSDVNGTALHEAWAEALISDKFSLKMGRQEIVYDDHRIFGNVGWAQQARSHDALLARFKFKNQQKLDIGFALNSQGEPLFDQSYTVNNYKALQYLWYNGTFGDVTLSILVLNNGIEFFNSIGDKGIKYTHTIGPRIKYAKNKIAADAAFYYQGGEVGANELSATYFGGNISYKIHENISIGIGAEMISGTDANSNDDELKSFNPLYGTNHKFNGLMDYFYVGNHINSVGLNDYYFSLKYKKKKFSAGLTPHFFSADGKQFDVTGGEMDSNLGTEIDFTFSYKINESIALSGGYSQLFATDSMKELKGGFSDENNNWSWLMMTFKPELLNLKKQ